MASASLADAQSSSHIPPYHFIASAHHSNTHALLSANAVHLVTPTTVATIDTTVTVPQPTKPDQSDAARITNASLISFPRLAAFSPSDRFLALTGDDKALRVFKLQPDQPQASFAQGQEVLLKHLPKRAATVQWLEPRSGDTLEELIVTDKFGDVRSFLLDPAADFTSPYSEQPAASSSANSASEHAAQQEQDMDNPDDASMRILLGHVSMISSVDFIPAPSASSPHSFVITADRDEHIRISRWGPKRAAHVIERFLLGSNSFVGALHVLPQEAKLISADGGSAFRVWKLPEATSGRPSEQPLSSTEACISINLVDEALYQYVLVREREEKRRESLGYNPGGKKGNQRAAAKRKRQNDSSTPSQSADASEPVKESEPNVHLYSTETEPTLAITSLSPFQTPDGQKRLLFMLEGSNAFFHIPLSALLEDLPADSENKARDISSVVTAVDLGAPILGLSLKQGSSSPDISILATLDTRSEFHPQDSNNSKPRDIVALTWSGDRFSETDAGLPAAVKGRKGIEAHLLSALSLYSALCNWPKVEVPTAAEMLARRSSKGRLNTAAPTIGPDAHEEEGGRHQKMTKRIQDGKRAKGRERNRNMLGVSDGQ